MKKLIFTFAAFLCFSTTVSAQTYYSNKNIEKAIFNYRQKGQLTSVVHYTSDTPVSPEAIELFASGMQSKNGYLSIRRNGENGLVIFCENYVTDEHTQRLFQACGITAVLTQRSDDMVPGK